MEKASEDLVGTAIVDDGTYTFNVGPVKILVYKASITEVRGVDGIVSVANETLQPNGGTAGCVAEAAGQAMVDECSDYIRKHGPLNTAEVFVSKPGNLPCRGIIHTTSPRWSMHIGKEATCAEKLYQTVCRCLEEAKGRLWRSVAVCAIGSGKAGIPPAVCAAMFMKAFEDCFRRPRPALREVHLVDICEDSVAFMQEAHRKRLETGRAADFTVALQYSLNKTFTSGPSRIVGIPSAVANSKNDIDANKLKSPYNNKDTKSGKGAKNDRNVKNDKDNGEWVEYIPDSQDTEKGFFVRFFGSDNDMSLSVKIEKGKSKPTASGSAENDDQTSTCPICFDTMKKVAMLKCSHGLCKDCLKKLSKPVCPVCNAAFGVETGNQPDGKMFTRTTPDSLPGYESSGTIEICYVFADGTQKSSHPHPGKPYKGTSRRAYLPDTAEGREVLELLKQAFSRCLTFTVGASRTTGLENRVTWNDIHHKTARRGGQYSYPDSTYLRRVKEELAAKGILSFKSTTKPTH